MKFFRRRSQKDEEEISPKDAEAPAPRRRWLPLRRRSEQAEEEKTVPLLRRRKVAGPAEADEAGEPLAMEIAGSRHFTVVLGQPRDPDHKPLELPSLEGQGRRWLFGRRRLSPADEVAALVGTLSLEEERQEEPQEESEVEASEEAPDLPEEAPPMEAVETIEAPEAAPHAPRGGLLVGASTLAAAAVGVLVHAGVLPPQVIELWPLAFLALGVLLALVALPARDAGRLLGGASLVALGAGGGLVQAGTLSWGASLAAALTVALGVTVLVSGIFWRERRQL